MIRVWLSVAVLAYGHMISAQENAAGWADFRDGRYEDAIAKALAEGSADAYALACRSHIVLGGFYSQGDTAVMHLHKAIEYCGKSVSLDDRNLVGRMTYAMAAGFEGKRLFSPRYPAQSRKHLEYLAYLYPENPLAVAAIGGWHSEVYAAGFFARVALGGSRKKAREYFARALELGETNIPLHLEYVKFLTRDGKDAYPEAIAEIDRLLAREPEVAFDALLQEKARELKAALETGSKRTVRDTIKAIAAFNGIEDWKSADAYDLELEAPDTDD